MKKIIISEDKQELLMSLILNESLSDGYQSSNVLKIKEYLDSNFTKATNDIGTFDDNGDRVRQSYVALLDNNKNVIRLMTDRQVFDLLQEKFKTIMPNNTDEERKKRDQFIKKVLVSWYNNKITKEGSLLSK